MRYVPLAVVTLLTVSGCASTLPPLHEEDGRARRQRPVVTAEAAAAATDEAMAERARAAEARAADAAAAIEAKEAARRLRLAEDQAKRDAKAAEAKAAADAKANAAALAAAEEMPKPPREPRQKRPRRDAATVDDVAAETPAPAEPVREVLRAQPTVTPLPRVALPTVTAPTPANFPELGSAAPVKPTTTGNSSAGPYFTATPANLPVVAPTPPAPATRPAPVKPAVVSAPVVTPPPVTVPTPEVPRSAPPSPRASVLPPQLTNAPPATPPANAPVVAVPAPLPPPPAATAAIPEAPPAVSAATADLQRAAALKAVERINAYRAQFGFAPLAYSERLSAAALTHVIELAQRGEVSSVDAAGNSIGGRLKRAGYAPLVAASLASGGYRNLDDALTKWQTDEVERSRLLLQGADEIGFAVITDRTSKYGTYIEAIIAAE